MTSIELEDHFTLLGVRADGVAPLVDLLVADDLSRALDRARAWLGEHASCTTVEVWRDGALLGSVSRA